jgi:drug/metabolite transporter (DMT)-like permease
MSTARTPEEHKAERLAKLFDLRSFIGSLFVVFGVLVTITGLTASQEDIDKALGVNLSLWMGIIMLAVGAVFIAWMLATPPRIEHGHEVTEEDVPEQFRGHH